MSLFPAKPKTHPETFRCTDDLANRIKGIAKSKGLSKNSVMVGAIDVATKLELALGEDWNLVLAISKLEQCSLTDALVLLVRRGLERTAVSKR